MAFFFWFDFDLDFGIHQPLNYCSATVNGIVNPKIEFLFSSSFKPINMKEKMFSLEYSVHSFGPMF